MWFGSTQSGAVRFDPETFVSFTTADGLVENRVTAGFVGKDGSGWFGHGILSMGGRINGPAGLSRYNRGKFSEFSPSGGLSNVVTQVLGTPSGEIWLATDGGLVHLDGQTLQRLSVVDGLLANEVVGAALAPDGSVWATTANGISHYHKGGFENFPTTNGPPKTWFTV
jgi:ligand-binding sensor domain-containing protein